MDCKKCNKKAKYWTIEPNLDYALCEKHWKKLDDYIKCQYNQF